MTTILTLDVHLRRRLRLGTLASVKNRSDQPSQMICYGEISPLRCAPRMLARKALRTSTCTSLRNGAAPFRGDRCTAGLRSGLCPLWVKSRHWGRCGRCPLYPQKRTSQSAVAMSALCQKETLARLSDRLTGFPQPTKPSPQTDNPSVNWPGMCAMRELMLSAGFVLWVVKRRTGM